LLFCQTIKHKQSAGPLANFMSIGVLHASPINVSHMDHISIALSLRYHCAIIAQ